MAGWPDERSLSSATINWVIKLKMLHNARKRSLISVINGQINLINSKFDLFIKMFNNLNGSRNCNIQLLSGYKLLNNVQFKRRNL